MAIKTWTTGEVVTASGANDFLTNRVPDYANTQVTSPFSTSSTSYVTTGISLTITPKATSSKVLLQWQTSGFGNFYLTIYRNGSNVASANDHVTYSNSSTPWHETGFNFVDSPSTTSAITYTIYMKSLGGTVYLNSGDGGGQTSSFTALELNR
jgi:hypothetical protein